MTNDIVNQTNGGSNDGEMMTQNWKGLPLGTSDIPNVSSAIVKTEKFNGSNFKSWQQDAFLSDYNKIGEVSHRGQSFPQEY